MAPELVLEKEYDWRVDIWSLGILCVELAEMRPPLFDLIPLKALFIITDYNKPPPTLQDPKSFPKLDLFISNCLDKNPFNRKSASDLLEHPFVKESKSPLLLIELVDRFKQQLLSKPKVSIFLFILFVFIFV